MLSISRSSCISVAALLTPVFNSLFRQVNSSIPRYLEFFGVLTSLPFSRRPRGEPHGSLEVEADLCKKCGFSLSLIAKAGWRRQIERKTRSLSENG